MYSVFIKYYFIFLFSIYICLKLLNHSFKNFNLHGCIFSLALLLTSITQIPFIRNLGLSHIVPLLMLWIIISLLTSSPQITFVVIFLAFGISYGVQALTSFISTFIVCILIYPINDFAFLLISIISAFLHTSLSIVLLHIKRLQKGLPLFNSSSYINISCLLCLVIGFLPTYPARSTDPFIIKLISFIAPISLLAFLIFWWQAQITKTYRHRLLMRELESRRTSEAEKDALIAKLYAENERLARITHRDNSLITALKDAAIKGLRTHFDTPEEMLATREKLIANIEKLAEGRSTISSDYNEKKARYFDTGLSLLDDLLHHMDSQALEQEILFSVHFGTSLVDFVPQCISENDLVHTVDDLLKNAFKATRTCESRAVQLQFYKLGKHLVLEIADNGIPFEIRSLVNMGIEKLTTYEDGNGIGLMDIWSTKEKYRATYHLDEYASTTPFSKKISLTFDKKNRYTIRTYRKNEILQMSRRADMQVYDDPE